MVIEMGRVLELHRSFCLGFLDQGAVAIWHIYAVHA